ncbi:MAG: dTMP kinase [Actinomycetia bacterium]|nr:dTMP kinase [Actinomycetes bacterium]
MKGLFITFEGPDGSGKTTQIELLTGYLKEKGREVVTAIEPGGTKLGKKIRHMLLDKENTGMSHTAETLLFQASRAELVSKVISPALKADRIVICDRFFDSTIVYQGIARGLGKEKILDMSLWATGGLVPDLTFLLSLDVSRGEERISGSLRDRDRIEMEEDKFKQKICEGYLELAEEFKGRIISIDAGQEIKAVFNTIREKVDGELRKR